MRILGMISGTSHDGIDCAVVEFTEQNGAVTGTLRYETSVPYRPELRKRLSAALPPTPTTLSEICQLDTLIGQAFADAAEAATTAIGGVDAVCSHGQTVYHWVDGDRARGTLQIGQPAWIAERIQAPVVSDARIRDITVGGHGAPLVSFLDDLLLRGRAGTAAALNLGGISNMTVITGDHVTAYDIGPANALIDAVIVAHHLTPHGYDDGARIAQSGRVDDALLAQLLSDPYYARPTPKSTGKEHFHLGYVQEQLAVLGHPVAAVDLVATLTELTVRTVIAQVVQQGVSFLAVSGGGCRNPLMLQGLRKGLPGVEVVLSDELGVPTDSKEAILFALIGWCTLHGVPAIVPSATGARVARILGTITPGAGPLVMPTPVTAITSLTLTASQ